MLGGLRSDQRGPTRCDHRITSQFSGEFGSGRFHDTSLHATTARVNRITKRRESLDKAVKLGLAEPDALALLDKQLNEIPVPPKTPRGRPKSARPQRPSSARSTTPLARPQTASLLRHQDYVINTCVHCHAQNRVKVQQASSRNKSRHSQSPTHRSPRPASSRVRIKPVFDETVIERNTRSAVEWATLRRAAMQRAQQMRERRIHGPPKPRKSRGSRKRRAKLEQHVDEVEHIYDTKIIIPTSPLRASLNPQSTHFRFPRSPQSTRSIQPERPKTARPSARRYKDQREVYRLKFIEDTPKLSYQPKPRTSNNKKRSHTESAERRYIEARRVLTVRPNSAVPHSPSSPLSDNQHGLVRSRTSVERAAQANQRPMTAAKNRPARRRFRPDKNSQGAAATPTAQQSAEMVLMKRREQQEKGLGATSVEEAAAESNTQQIDDIDQNTTHIPDQLGGVSTNKVKGNERRRVEQSRLKETLTALAQSVVDSAVAAVLSKLGGIFRGAHNLALTKTETPKAIGTNLTTLSTSSSSSLSTIGDLSVESIWRCSECEFENLSSQGTCAVCSHNHTDRVGLDPENSETEEYEVDFE